MILLHISVKYMVIHNKNTKKLKTSFLVFYFQANEYLRYLFSYLSIMYLFISRLIVRYLSVRKDKEELAKFFQDQESKIRHVKEFLDVMSVISSDSRYRKIKEKILPKAEKGEISMCLLLDMAEERGEERGAYMKALEIAENLLKAGQKIASVAMLTGLSEAEVTEVSEKM